MQKTPKPHCSEALNPKTFQSNTPQPLALIETLNPKPL